MGGPVHRREGATSIVELGASSGRLSLVAMRRLADALRDAEADQETRVILVEGPPGTFCAGGDVADYLSAEGFDELERVARRFFSTLITARKPLVAAVDGEAIGLGMTMLLHFDAVFASPDSTFLAPFIDLGLVPEAGSTLLAPSRFGYLRAFEVLCLGRKLTASDALDFGLISAVTPAGETAAYARAAASRLARKPVEAVRATRELLRGGRDGVTTRIDAELAQFRRQLEDTGTARRLARIAKLGDREAA